MRKWIPVLLAVLFVIVCLLLAAPAPASAVITPYIRFVTAAGWTAVLLIVAFLAYVVYTAKKR
ncbi:MAG: hypothetical protein IKV57_02595 [Clostridia bacterium]|nr:hypothetical protein [Clostridia bacterium]